MKVSVEPQRHVTPAPQHPFEQLPRGESFLTIDVRSRTPASCRVMAVGVAVFGEFEYLADPRPLDPEAELDPVDPLVHGMPRMPTEAAAAD